MSGGRDPATTIAVIRIWPSPHTGQRERSMPVSRCSRTATESGPGGLGGGWSRSRTAPRQRPSTRAIREQAKVPNAHEAARHHVQEKAAQEFVGLERHDLYAVVVGVVLPAETDTAVAVIDEPIIGQRDAVRVSPEVVEHLLGAGEGPLRMDDPVDGPQPTEEDGEGAAIGEIGGATGEGQLAGVERTLQAGEIFRAKDRRHRPNGKQERRSTGDPPRAVRGQGAARDEAMELEVLQLRGGKVA